MGSMRITTKFIGSSALLIALSALLSGGSYWVNRQGRKSLEASYAQTQSTVFTSVQIKSSLQNQITALSRLSVMVDQSTEATAQYERARQQFFQALDELSVIIPAADQTSHLRIEGIRQQHGYLDTLAQRLSEDDVSFTQAEDIARSLKLFEQSTGNYIETLLKSANQQTVVYSEQQKLLHSRLAWLEGLSFLLMSLLLLGQFYYLLRPVIASLRQLQEGADKIGQSKLETVPTIELRTNDELQALAEAFNHMGETLSASYQELERRVAARTQSLHNANQSLLSEVSDRIEAETSLKEALTQLKQTQLQLLQTEKMSSLGQLVAGVAHEINNPVSFIQGNLAPAEDYMNSLLSLVRQYQSEYPEASDELCKALEQADLDFIQTDFPELLKSMKAGSDRIKVIVQSLKTFSRLDESETKSVDLHEGLDNSLILLTSQLSETPHRPAIEIERHYGELPNVYCYPGQLNQVFMGILTNAIDILTPSAHPVQKAGSDPKTSGSSSLKQPTIRLMTEATEDYVRIHISDNGGGMDKSTCHQIFDPFFTTKPVGSGMGLGLAMAYQIVVANHYGELTCTSAVGKGTTFTIEVPLTLKLKMQPVVTSPKLITA